jgi:hypothetical protein
MPVFGNKEAQGNKSLNDQYICYKYPGNNLIMN